MKKSFEYPHRSSALLAVVALFMTVPLSFLVVFMVLRSGIRTTSADTSEWFIPYKDAVVIGQKKVCPLLNSSGNGANIEGQDGGASVLADGKSFFLFGDTKLKSGPFLSNNIAMSTDLDGSDCISLSHKQSGGNAQEILPPDAANPIKKEEIVWPDSLVQVKPGEVHFFYVSGIDRVSFTDENTRGVGLAKFNTATWNTANAQRTNVYWETGNWDVNGDGKHTFGVKAATALQHGGYVYIIFQYSNDYKVGRVSANCSPTCEIEDLGKYQYWDGSGWVGDLNMATSIFPNDFVNGLSIEFNQHIGKFTMVYSDMFDRLDGRVTAMYKNYIRVADNVVGPWSEPVMLDDCNKEHTIAPGQFFLCYAGRQHSEYAKNNGQVLYYSDAVSDEVSGDGIGGRLYLHEAVLGSAVNQWDNPDGKINIKVEGDSVGGATKRGVLFYASKGDTSGFTAIKQWFNSSSGEYLYDANNPGAGFSDQGTAFYAPLSVRPGFMPVYRWDKSSDSKIHTYSPLNLTDFGFTRGPRVFYAYMPDYVSPSGTGFDLLNHPEKIGKKQLNVSNFQVSSHERDGGNNDVGGASNPNYYLYQEGSNYVIFDDKGPGAINRLWFTYGVGDAIGNNKIMFYFDGETSPRFEMTVNEFFSGKKEPFAYPFVTNYRASSGGNTSYLPIPYAESLKIAINAYPTFYYDINFEKYHALESVSSLTGLENLSQAKQIWLRSGVDPKPTSGNTVQNGTENIGQGSTKTIFQKNGSGSVNSLKLTIPQLVEAPAENIEVKDEGQGHKNSSEFYVSIDPNNSGVKIVKRYNANTSPVQSATVYVDGNSQGTWAINGTGDAVDIWRNSSFDIPSSATASKRNIKLKFQYVSGNDWSDYYYWIYSKVNGQDVLVDILDVGDTSSSVYSMGHHAYTVGAINSTTSTTSEYPKVGGDQTQQAQSRDVLTQARIKIYWDGESQPSVDAPLGAFFGSYGGLVETKSLMFGMNGQTKTMYSYFPMPYSSSVKIDIVNASGVAIGNLGFEVATNTQKFSDDKFFAKFNSQVPTVAGSDYKLLETVGAGKIVGAVMYMHGLPVGVDRARQYLEGDERFYVDDSKTPDIYGTGTEDYFNGAYYFERGFMNNPSYGYNLNILEGSSPNILANTGAYRLHVVDPINFRSKIRLGMEHGDPGMVFWENTRSSWPADYYSLVFYYGSGNSNLQLTDTLDVGDLASQTSHEYSAPSSSAMVSESLFYEGDDDIVSVTDNGHTSLNNISFKATIEPNNEGVVIRRRSNQNVGRQLATVTVEGKQLGSWYAAGSNQYMKWRDDSFVVPKSVTSGKSNLNIQLNAPGVPWSAYTYWIYTIKQTTANADTDGDGCTDAKELGTNPALGGDRNPNDPWDFYDVNGDKRIDLSDTLDILGKFGIEPGFPGYDPKFDRYAPDSAKPYKTAADNNGIDLSDALLNLESFGHGCE